MINRIENDSHELRSEQLSLSMGVTPDDQATTPDHNTYSCLEHD